MKFPPETMPCACSWSVGNHSHYKEISTFKFSRMETFCSVEVELTWMGPGNRTLKSGAVEGQLLFNFKERAWRSGQKTLDM